MQKLMDQIVGAIWRAGLVEVEISARHVHLTEQDTLTLFGKMGLTPKRDLSQPGQYLSEERVSIIGSKGRKENVAVLGPVRPASQVELSRSDCIELGVSAPLRESGNTSGSGSIMLEGPCGTVFLSEGAIVAQNHIHVPSDVVQMIDVKDRDHVAVEMMTERPIIFKDVVIRVSNSFSYRMHIDFDEANAAAVRGFTLGKIIKNL